MRKSFSDARRAPRALHLLFKLSLDRNRITHLLLAGAVLFIVSAACSIPRLIEVNSPPTTTALAGPTATATPVPTPVEPRLLTICMGQEPGSLFLYADASIAARSVRQSIYDGPLDVLAYQFSPVILQEIPGLENGGVRFEPLTIDRGSVIVDNSGNLNKLTAGIEYRPAGCETMACAQIYSGQGSVQMDEMVVRFRLLPDLLWSDGTPLTADDSRYSFELAQALYPQARAELLNRTRSYQALDVLTVEWRSLPGFRQAGYATNFFTPLPRHAWGSMQMDELLASEQVNRQPLGWGAYVIEDWRSGDHISLRRNPNYVKMIGSAAPGLPKFDRLVFRFITDQKQAVNALLAGECDYLDETVALNPLDSSLRELEQSGQIALAVAVGSAWEHLDFGIASFTTQEEAALPLFAAQETRQAVALCIDRQRLNTELFQGMSQVLDSYVPQAHPLFNPEVQRYPFDPQAAGALLESVGWLEDDRNSQTPRRAQAVADIPDGTEFRFRFLTTTETEKLRAAEIMQESLMQCGISMEIDSRPWEEVYRAGPSGPLFGRNFTLAQFSWVTSSEPPCFLYTTAEIPGPYPAFPPGWGGANVSGYSNPQFDRLCQEAQTALPGSEAYQQAHYQAQMFFSQQLPALPLYLRLKVVAARPSLCGLLFDASAESALWNLENFASGADCP